MAHLQNIQPDPGPDYTSLFKNLRPPIKPKPPMEFKYARMAEHVICLFISEVFWIGNELFQEALVWLIQLVTIGVMALVDVLKVVGFLGMVQAVDAMLQECCVAIGWWICEMLDAAAPWICETVGIAIRWIDQMLDATVFWIDGMCMGVNGVFMVSLWIEVWNYLVKTGRLGVFKVRGKGLRSSRVKFVDYKTQTPKDTPSKWFPAQPAHDEAYPTPSSKRTWNFSYPKTGSVQEPLTPPITPVKCGKKKALTELLGFVPQLLLDDIADAATDTVNNAIDGLEDYLRKWIAAREQQPPSDDLEAEIENGLLEFHTLLCGHRDMSIDMLETWSMRNVFHVPPELRIVMPHQRGLDLGVLPGRDVKAQVELDVMRRKIEHARKFQEQLKRAEEITQQRLERAEARLEKLRFLKSLDPASVESLPNQIRTLFTSLRTLSTAVPPLPNAPAEGTRPHTESRPEFLDWAIRRLVDPATGSTGRGVGGGGGDLGAMVGGVRGDEEDEDERRLVGGVVRVEEEREQDEMLMSSQDGTLQEREQSRGRPDLSTIQEADDQDLEDVTQAVSVVGDSSSQVLPSSSQALPPSSQAPLPSSQALPSSSQIHPSSEADPPSLQPSSSSQALQQNSSNLSLYSEQSSTTITTIKRRRSSMVGPGMGGVGGKRRRSSLGLAERAR
ncbi:hypothetical protein FRC07_007130, partial [Ceratobasidium sp. 392]